MTTTLRPHPLTRPLAATTFVALSLALSACATSPSMGGNKGSVRGSAAGTTTTAENGNIERCDESLGTLAIDEDSDSSWYHELRRHQLGSTVPVLRLLVQQSNCFVLVERGRSFNNMKHERELQASGELRQGSQFQAGQMVGADYTMRPSIHFAGNTGGANASLFTGKLAILSSVAGNIGRNEASTTLLLLDNRSGVQVSASEGTASNLDFGFSGSNYTRLLSGSGGAYAKTPRGKVVVSAFADSFNQMVVSLRDYRAQTVKGGLGTGGRLHVDGANTKQ